MRSLLLAALLLAAYAANPRPMDGAAVAATYQVQQGDDTLLTAPWIQEQLRAWTPELRVGFCIASFAAWPRFYFLRHLSTATPCLGGTPMLLQGPCPERIDPTSRPDFVIVQCGPDRFRLYHRARPQGGTRVH